MSVPTPAQIEAERTAIAAIAKRVKSLYDTTEPCLIRIRLGGTLQYLACADSELWQAIEPARKADLVNKKKRRAGV